MSTFTRRNFLKPTSSTFALGSVGFGFPHIVGAAKKRVVVIGGGVGGTIAAKYIAKADPSIQVTSCLLYTSPSPRDS